MELRDFIAVAGMATAALGIALISVPVALIVTGASATLLAVAADRRRPR